MVSIEELILKIEDPANIKDSLAASGPYVLRKVFEMDKTVQEIVEHEGDAEELVLKRIQERREKEIDDITMACFCYILEKIGAEKAVPELGNVLSEVTEKRKGREMAFTQYFAVHTIKTLAKKPNLKADLDYPDEEIEKTIKEIKSSGGGR